MASCIPQSLKVLLSRPVMTPNCVTWMKGPRGGFGEGGTDFTISQSSSHRDCWYYLASDWSQEPNRGLLLANRGMGCHLSNSAVLSLSLAVWLLFRSAGLRFKIQIQHFEHHHCRSECLGPLGDNLNTFVIMINIHLMLLGFKTSLTHHILWIALCKPRHPHIFNIIIAGVSGASGRQLKHISDHDEYPSCASRIQNY